MTSQLNVDTIVDKAGSGGPSLPNTTTIKIGNTSTYVSEGGAVTQNTVQGLGKVWCVFDMLDDADYILDSLNSASFTDHTTGSASITFSNAMNSVYYSSTAMTNGHSDSREFNVLCFDLKQNQAGTLPATGFLKVENLAGSSGSGGTPQDPSYACLTIHGDLA